MTKKDYERIAATLSTQLENHDHDLALLDAGGMTVTGGGTWKGGFFHAYSALVAAFEEDNPRFDRDWFWNAVYDA